MMMTLGFVSLMLAGPGAHTHGDDGLATRGSIYAVEACRGRCSAEDRRTLYRGHIVLLDGAPDLEELRGRDGWDSAKFPRGSNGCFAVRRYRDESSGSVLPEPVGFNAAVTWSRTETGALAFTFMTDRGDPFTATLERRGPNWVGVIRPDGVERDGDQIVIWQVGSGGTEHCVTLAK